MTTTVLPAQIHHSGQTIRLPDGCSLRIETERDETAGAPWEEDESHGPVSEWTTRDKRPGECILTADGDSRRYYDFAEAIRIAKRDGWWGPGTPAEAAESDFQFLRDWCADKWEYIGVIVTLQSPDGAEVARDSIWLVESCGDYWKTVAAEIAEQLLAGHAKETEERAY